MKAQGLNQAYMLNLRTNYYTVLICSFYYSYKQKVYTFFLYSDNTEDSLINTENDMETENNLENNNILRIFINILDGFLDLISSK